MLAISNCVVRSCTRRSRSALSCNIFSSDLFKAFSVSRRSATSFSSASLVCSRSCRPLATSSSISLNATTKSPISSSLVLDARKVKSRDSASFRATPLSERIGPITLLCKNSEIPSDTSAASKIELTAMARFPSSFLIRVYCMRTKTVPTISLSATMRWCKTNESFCTRIPSSPVRLESTADVLALR